MKEILHELGFVELPNLSEFVRAERWRRTDYTRLSRIVDYTELITQRLTKSMFVPCGEDGAVLLEPERFKDYLEIGDMEGVGYKAWFEKCKLYHEAVARVLFQETDRDTERRICDIHTPNNETIEQAINNGVKLKLI